MLEIKKYGAIDIGSNAVRLLISNVIISEEKEPKFKKSSLIRVPIRLGADAFVSELISNENIIRMINALKSKNEEFEIWGTGKPVREWCYIDDVINIIIKICTCKL